ncbi:Inner membrane ALBINO3-like protein 1, chloroplastic [Coccomyxa sp. Obi]|nr:Inner membrane ALBINO3-like protein 1, chloroplastic [Coccomyxa sp. Obi]
MQSPSLPGRAQNFASPSSAVLPCTPLQSRIQGWHTKPMQRRRGLTVRGSAELNSFGAEPQEQLAALMYSLADAAVVQPAAVQAAAQDDGWLAPISSGLNYSLQQIQTGLDTLHVPYSYGWAIIVLTIGTKILTFPFTKVQVESALAVQKLRPTIDAIKRQYGDDKKSIQRETSALYEASGVNPAAGCLPTLATIPIFWGLYRTLSNVASAGLLTEGFYWIPSLSGPTSLAAQRAGTGTAWLFPFVDGAPPVGWEDAARYLVLPVALVAAQFASSAVISPPIDDEDPNANFSKALLLFVPFMVGWFALNVPSGLSLYYFSNTIITSGIQIWLRKLGGAKAFEWQQDIGLNQARRSGEVAVLDNLLQFHLEEPSTSGHMLPGASDAASAVPSQEAGTAVALSSSNGVAPTAVASSGEAAPPSMRAKRKRRSILEAQGSVPA